MLEYINAFWDQLLFWIGVILVLISTIASTALTAWLFSDDARKRRDIVLILIFAYVICALIWWSLYYTFDIVRTT